MGVVFNSLRPINECNEDECSEDEFNEAVFNEAVFNEDAFHETVYHEIFCALHNAIRCINANRLQCYRGS